MKFATVRVDLGHFLFGNVQGLGDADLWITYGLSFLIVLVLAIFQRQVLLAIFDPAVAASIGIRVAWFDCLLIALMGQPAVRSGHRDGIERTLSRIGPRYGVIRRILANRRAASQSASGQSPASGH